ncbi:MAG: hypothetical protein LBI42_05575 [Chitinispirillales bacterium]|jgi:flagellar motor component MotA|nr:hypothetical protein [Chitinispirillales bacterium]
MIRYFLSLGIFFAGVISTIIVSGGSPLFFINLPSFIIVGILPFLFVSTIFGFKEMAWAFSITLKKEVDKEELLNALNFFKYFGKTIWIASLIAVLIGVITILGFLGDMSALGQNLSIALISILYSALFNIVIIIPFTVFIKKKMNE